MDLNIVGASKRPKLTLPFGGRAYQKSPASDPGQFPLSGPELRRVVAAMVD
jgi:hypothetical protein